MSTALAIASAGLAVGLAAPASAVAVTVEGAIYPAGLFDVTLTKATGAARFGGDGGVAPASYTSNDVNLQTALRSATRTLNVLGTTVTFTGVALGVATAGTATITVADAAFVGGAGDGTITGVITLRLAALGDPPAASNRFTVTLTDALFKDGTIAARDFEFAGPNAAAFAAARFTRVSETIVVINRVGGLLADGNTITIPAATTRTFDPAATVRFTSATQAPVASAAFVLEEQENAVTITLTGGLYASEVGSMDFVFDGTDAGVLNGAMTLGTFERTSDTVVTIFGFSGRVGINNTVTVEAPAIAANGTVTGFGALVARDVAITPAPANDIITVTLIGGTFVGGDFTAGNFAFAGSITNQARLRLAGVVYTRTSDTVVTISGLSGLVAEATTIIVNVLGTVENAPAFVTAVGSTTPAPPAPVVAPVVTAAPVVAPVVPAAPVVAPVVPAAPVVAPVVTAAAVVQGLTPTQVQGLSAGALSALPPTAFAVMSPAQVKALNPPQVSGFSAAQIQAIPADVVRAMKPRTLNAFKVGQIRALTKEQASELRVNQINRLGKTKARIVNAKR